MRAFDLIKTMLFPGRKQQNELIAAMPGSPDFDQAFHTLFFETKEKDLQTILAPFMRSQTIRHLKYSQSQYATDFRKTYQDIYNTPCKTYLDVQSKAGEWGTEVEAGGLADLLNMTVMVTPVTRGDAQTSTKFREAADRTAPIIHLYNSDNTHWYIYDGAPGETLGDGNCLYNAYAQALRHIVLHEKANDTKMSSDNSAVVDPNIHVYKTQADLISIATGAPLITMDELLKNLRSRTNDPSDQADHDLGVELAKEEMAKLEKPSLEPEVKEGVKVSQDSSYRLNQWLPAGALLFGAGVLVGAVLAFTGIFAPVGLAISGIIEMAVMCGVAACVLGGPVFWYCDSDSDIENKNSYKTMMSDTLRKSPDSAFEPVITAEKPAVAKKAVVQQQAPVLKSDDMSAVLNSISLK